METPLIREPVAVLAVLMGVLAGLFAAESHPVGKRFFRVVPLLIFAYFIPTALSNVGLIPLKSPLYEFVKWWLLPASLLLLTMSVDIPAILKLGRKVLILFFGATATIETRFATIMARIENHAYSLVAAEPNSSNM